MYVYTGADGSFEFYEDENVNYNYEKGKFAVIPFTIMKRKKLVIGDREGEFDECWNENSMSYLYRKPSCRFRRI